MDHKAHSLWLACLGHLQLHVPKPSYDTWLKGTIGLAFNGDTLTIGAPTIFAREWLERRMLPLIQQVASRAVGSDIHVILTTGGLSEQPPGPTEGDTSEPYTRPSEATTTPTPGSNERRKYTFENFVVGDCNQFAYTAAYTIARHPGKEYNPLFIYSDVGLGKTHLLRAIADDASLRDLHSTYVTAEQFTADFVKSIREKRAGDFRARYHATDLLLIDDIQFLAGKEQTQVGFFNTFNDLHHIDKQIVIACDRPPSAVSLLEDRLRSRFQCGLVVDIQPPDVETRAAILLDKAERCHVNLGSDIADLIAGLSINSIRQLEGHLNKVIALSSFLGKAITRELVANALGEAIADSPATDPATAEGLLALVAKYYNVTTAQLQSRSADRRTTEEQRVAMYVLRTFLKLPPEDTGKVLGDWTRRTVSNSVKGVEQRLASDHQFKKRMDGLISQF